MLLGFEGESKNNKPDLKWSKSDTNTSKTLSYILRHGALAKKIPIRPDGYVKVSDLLSHPELKGCLDLATIVRLVRFNMKRRYALAIPQPATDENPTGGLAEVNPEAFANLDHAQTEEATRLLYIRALQGHSMPCIDNTLLYELVKDPNQIPTCVHGTYWRKWHSVLRWGLYRMSRLHIHFAKGLPGDPGILSGIRANAEVAIFVNVRKAMDAGIRFWLSGNGVILTEGIDGVLPPEFFSQAVTLPHRRPVALIPEAAPPLVEQDEVAVGEAPIVPSPPSLASPLPVYSWRR